MRETGLDGLETRPVSPYRSMLILVLVYKCGQEKSNNLYY